MKKKLKSKIKQFFSDDLLVELWKIPYMDETQELKAKYMFDTLNNYGIKFFALGSGTNRVGIQIEDTVFKIALDKHGKIDNMREFKYTDILQPYVIKVYECLPDGLIAACETYIPMTQDDFITNKEEILEIIGIMAKKFFIGDIGFDPNKNYANWGFRKTDGAIGILDFAYIYSVEYNTFTCICDNKPFLNYDENFVKMICPVCGRKWTFGELRKRISKSAESKEIGDVKKISYNLHSKEESVEVNYNYTLTDESLKRKETEKERIKRERKEMFKQLKEKREKKNEEDFNVLTDDDKKSFEEIIQSIQNKEE